MKLAEINNNGIKKVVKTQAELLQEVQEEKDFRVNECLKEIDEVMKKHNCKFTAEVTITSKGVIPKVIVFAL